jgi:sulfide:quinone oxidoreductase
MLIADFLSKQGLSGKIRASLYTPEPQPMPVAGPELGKAAIDMLQSRGIEYYPGHRLQSVDPADHRMVFDGKGETDYDLLVAIPPHRCPDVVAQSSLSGETGWIPVERSTLRTKVDNIYAIGDVTSIPLPGRWNPEVPMSLPKAGVFAHTQGLIVAHRIVGEITGKATQDTFCGDGYCMLEAGEDLAGFAYGNFFAEPSPQVNLKRIGKAWHIGKVLFEKMWLTPPGVRKRVYETLIATGSRLYGVPTQMHS